MNPIAWLFALFLAIPILEVYLIIQVGSAIGAGWTIVLIIATAAMGAWLLRLQGIATLMRVRSSMERGEVPAIEMLEGVVLLVGGALLLTPGFFTDAIGFVCLLPFTRRALVMAFLRKSQMRVYPGKTGQTHHDPDSIEGECWHEDDQNRS